MRSSRRLVLAASSTLAAIAAAPALAVYVCHPDPPGTRTLAVSGSVERYAVSGPRVSVAVRTPQACNVVAWNLLTGLHATTGASCLSLLGRNLTTTTALRAVVVPANAAGPDTLAVLRGGEQVARWPLPVRPRTMHVSSGYAVFAGRDGGAYALRLRDGRVAALGAAVAGDVPQVDDLGAVFAARQAYSSRTGVKMKFVPTTGIDMEVDQAARP